MEEKLKIEQAEIIKTYQRKRLKKKIRLAIASLIFAVFSIACIVTYNSLNVDTYVNCMESSNVDYKAYLKQNDFYDKEFLTKGTNVVASLIKNIEANFKYDMTFDQELEYIYDYDITAKIEVLEENEENVILEKEEELLTVTNKTAKNKKLSIDEKVDIDYETYNDILNNFIATYSLKDTSNRLVLTMRLNVINAYDGTQINKNDDVMTIKIPLTTQTVNIEILTNSGETNGQVLVFKKESEPSIALLYVGFALFALAFIELIRFVKYSMDVRSAETMYEQTLKKIMLGYKNYIQEINNDIKEEEYEKLELSSFNDLLEMRDVINAPILMRKEAKYRTKFLMIDHKRVFVYVLDANLIREKLREISRQKNEKKERKD